MTTLVSTLAQSSSSSSSPLRKAFLKWQCRVRQNAMRDAMGRPDDGITPALFLQGSAEPLGHVITLMNKLPAYTVMPELKHMLAKTNDPAQRRDQAIKFLSASYYQKATEFSDVLTVTFPPGSPGAAQICAAGEVRLVFDAFAQVFDLTCEVTRLTPDNPLHQASFTHNKLFNPALSPDIEILGFAPDWSRSSSDPPAR